MYTTPSYAAITLHYSVVSMSSTGSAPKRCSTYIRITPIKKPLYEKGHFDWFTKQFSSKSRISFTECLMYQCYSVLSLLMFWDPARCSWRFWWHDWPGLLIKWMLALNALSIPCKKKVDVIYKNDLSKAWTLALFCRSRNWVWRCCMWCFMI